MSSLSLHVLFRRAFLFGKRFHQDSSALKTVMPPSLVGEVMDTFSARYSTAEVAASKFGNLYRSAYLAIYLLSSLAVGMALLTMALPDLSAWFVSIETLTILSILAIFVFGSRQNWHAQWLAFRKEAEVLRYLPVIHIASRLSSHLAKREQQESQSQQVVSRELSFEVPIDINTHERECLQRLDQLIKDGTQVDQEFVRWVIFIIRGQIQYHEKRAFEEHVIHERIHKLAFFVSLLLLSRLWRTRAFIPFGCRLSQHFSLHSQLPLRGLPRTRKWLGYSLNPRRLQKIYRRLSN